MNKNFLKSFLVFLLISMLGSSLMLYVWTTIPSDSGLGGLFWLGLEFVLLPITFLFTYITHNLLVKKVNLLRLNLFVFMVFSLIPNILISIGPLVYYQVVGGFRDLTFQPTIKNQKIITIAPQNNTDPLKFNIELDVEWNKKEPQEDVYFTPEIVKLNGLLKETFLDINFEKARLDKGMNKLTSSLSLGRDTIICQNVYDAKNLRASYILGLEKGKKYNLDINIEETDKALKQIIESATKEEFADCQN